MGGFREIFHSRNNSLISVKNILFFIDIVILNCYYINLKFTAKAKGGVCLKKSDLVSEIAKSAGLTKKDAEEALNALVGSIKKALKKGDKVSIVGFGTFEISKRKARTGVNPQTGEKIKIKASKVPKFKPGKNFKDAIK
jgi:DNA-binding protein HU-beta